MTNFILNESTNSARVLNRKRRVFSSSLVALPLFLCALLAVPSISLQAQTYTMDIVVDASDLPRKLLHSQTTLQTFDSQTALLYPKWIPGIHGPMGPVQNIAGLTMLNSAGDTLSWERDWAEVYRFNVKEPILRGKITILLDYICSQPSVNSRGVDSYGEENIGIINWNTLLLYPEGVDVAKIKVKLRLVLPSGWKYGSAMPTVSTAGDTIVFAPTDLQTLIDCPLICGSNFRTIELATTEKASYYLHLAADDAGDLPRQDSVLIPLRNLVREAEAMFGGTHFQEYHFLLTLSDRFPRLGLEHLNSSLNGVSTGELRDSKWTGRRISYLLSHEFVHAWCGKFRRPAGMNTTDYQQTKNTDLLWVYEGLTQYLGNVLATRCGFKTTEEYVEDLASEFGTLIQQKGRRWRPLRDTEVSAYVLRGGSHAWGDLRRSQDYYREGGMLWLEFDGRIRNLTDGERSLDDFCADFFSPYAETHSNGSKQRFKPFVNSDLVEFLRRQADFNWDSLITLRIDQTQESFDTEAARQCGYRLEYTDEVPKRIKRYQDKRGSGLFTLSLGVSVSKSGKIIRVVPESAADLAELSPGDEIIGVSGKKFSVKRLEDAIRSSATTNSIEVLLLKGDTFREVKISYDDGLRYLVLREDDSRRNWLLEIIKARTPGD